jgi:alkyldihydroxyacetonephosphate synthase
LAIGGLADRFSRVLDPARVLTDPELLIEYRGIAWGPPTSRVDLRWPIGPPALAVQPASADEVAEVVAIARALGAPIVPYGAGTGVQAGATPLAGSILVDLGAMNRVIEINVDDQRATVEPGVVLGDLDGVAARSGLMVGHDPWSQPIASVGGATSTNGVGYLAGKYGSMGEQVLGLEAVLGTGETLSARPLPKASTGPQLRHLFIGAEGVFGLITRVDVRLFPIPEQRSIRGYWFPRFEDGLAAVQAMRAIGLRPAMIDYEEEARGHPPLGTQPDVPSAMYLTFDGFREEVDAQVARADLLCRAAAGTPMEPTEAEEFWRTRHQSAERYVEQRKQGSPWSTRRWAASHVNITLPASRLLEYRQAAAERLARHRLVLTASGLWAMPELYSVRFEHVEPDSPTAAAEVEAGTDEGLRLAQEMGGSMEYCHGVGLRYAHLMASEWGMGLDALRRLKRALDPDGLLNPGKLGL